MCKPLVSLSICALPLLPSCQACGSALSLTWVACLMRNHRYNLLHKRLQRGRLR